MNTSLTYALFTVHPMILITFSIFVIEKLEFQLLVIVANRAIFLPSLAKKCKMTKSGHFL